MKNDTRRGAPGRAGAAALLVAMLAGCNASAGAFGAGGSGGAVAGTSANTGTVVGTGAGGAPPEQQVESKYTAPIATGKYVWIANPTSGRVAYIDASTLEIKLVDAGNAPTFVAGVPDAVDDVAIVLNVLSSDATLLRASNGTVTASTFAVPSGGNTWAISPDGHWAIAWSDARRVDKPDPINGYQDMTVIDLGTNGHAPAPLSVGYRPVAVAFDKTSAHAYAVTQDGVSIIALSGAPAVTKNVPLSTKPADMGMTSDVAITPDGAYALVRRDNQPTIAAFALADGSRTDVAFPANVTDLRLSADGKTAVVVMRSTNQVALLPVPGVISNPSTFATVQFDTTVGSASLAPKSPVGFFYTSGIPSDVLAVMDTSSTPPTPHDILLRAPILAVFPTPDAAHAVVMHDALQMAGSQYAAAVSLVPVAAGLPPKIVGIDAPVTSVAVAPAGDHVLVAAGDEKSQTYEVLVGAFPSLKVDKLKLASLPIAAGIVAGAGRGYVAQKHPDGRITFIDFLSGEVRTLTGFELATQVTDGTP